VCVCVWSLLPAIASLALLSAAEIVIRIHV